MEGGGGAGRFNLGEIGDIDDWVRVRARRGEAGGTVTEGGDVDDDVVVEEEEEEEEEEDDDDEGGPIT